MSSLSKILRFVTEPMRRGVDTMLSRATSRQQQEIENLMVLQGRALALANADRSPFPRIQDAEFKVFSQFGEDGILQYLIRETGINREESTFVEFGVQDYGESNTRFLLINDDWRGLIIDGDNRNMEFVRSQDIYWRHDLTALSGWIDRGNVNRLIGDAGFNGDIGLLSIDIDGNDYWVWERLEIVRPIIVVVEWNSVFGSRHAVSVPYASDFQRQDAHYSNLYWGASIGAFVHLATRKGYALLGSNTAGNNLFFVRSDRLGRLEPVSASDAYVESRFRESRDVDGNLTFLSGAARRLAVIDLPVVEVVNGAATTLRALESGDR